MLVKFSKDFASIGLVSLEEKKMKTCRINYISIAKLPFVYFRGVGKRRLVPGKIISDY